MKSLHMIILQILIQVFLWFTLTQNIHTEEISNVAIANFIGKIEKFINSRDVDIYEKRKIFLKYLFEDEVIQKIAEKELVQFKFHNKKFPMNDEFPCVNYSVSESGTNINNLIPGNINVIAALGDSLTAGVGIGATSIFGILFEEKGKVFDIGGKKGSQTLPNFLKIYNSNIKGFATKTTFKKGQIDGLDVAVSGATSKDIMSQVETLIELLKSSEYVDMKNDWKLINIFIGNNDICRSCEEKNADSFTPKLFKERLIKALDKLKEEVPRAFVSVITMLDVYEIHNLNRGVICSLMHLFECPCVAFSSDIENIIRVTNEFQNVITEIGESDRYDGKDDFTVVTQPFFEETNIPYINGAPDLSYFASDCFHLSERGHGQVALSLWNSLFEPLTSKKRHWYVGEQFECPSINKPYFATKSNTHNTDL